MDDIDDEKFYVLKCEWGKMVQNGPACNSFDEAINLAKSQGDDCIVRGYQFRAIQYIYFPAVGEREERFVWHGPVLE